jgi:hypothetical protein
MCLTKTLREEVDRTSFRRCRRRRCALSCCRLWLRLWRSLVVSFSWLPPTRRLLCREKCPPSSKPPDLPTNPRSMASRSLIAFLVAASAASSAVSLAPFHDTKDPGGICTDTRCGGGAKICCENSTALQHPDVCNTALTCDSCCGWRWGAGLPTARVLPIGDSITAGVGGGGYRENLGEALAGNSTTAGRWSYVGLL